MDGGSGGMGLVSGGNTVRPRGEGGEDSIPVKVTGRVPLVGVAVYLVVVMVTRHGRRS